LQRFEQVCQTVSYAHSKGVLHRDLKPSNIMVGAFGEVQVMDWGLAKVMNTPTAAPEPAPAADARASTVYPSLSGSSPELTLPGCVLGTPAYMSPEQARGQGSHLDERADVFSLGAILCTILTGRPPYEADDARAALRQAAEGDIAAARARLESCGADPDLV